MDGHRVKCPPLVLGCLHVLQVPHVDAFPQCQALDTFGIQVGSVWCDGDGRPGGDVVGSCC